MMNKRIRQLWDEAANLEPDTSWEGQTRFMEKFAELIIQECIDELDGKIYNAIDHEGDETWPDLILKEHFGIEE